MVNDNFLRFPSGRSVGNCRKDAKKLKKTGLTLTQALDLVAEQNGLASGWDKALQNLRATSSVTAASHFLYSMIGKNNQDISRAKASLTQPDHPAETWLPDGEGKIIRAFPHKGTGVLITEAAQALLEVDIAHALSLGDVTELAYEVPGSTSHMTYSIQITNDGTISHFCRSLPVSYEADFYAEDWRVRYVGQGGYRPAESMLHWTSFCFWHSRLVPKAYS